MNTLNVALIERELSWVVPVNLPESNRASKKLFEAEFYTKIGEGYYCPKFRYSRCKVGQK